MAHQRCTAAPLGQQANACSATLLTSTRASSSSSSQVSAMPFSHATVAVCLRPVTMQQQMPVQRAELCYITMQLFAIAKCVRRCPCCQPPISKPHSLRQTNLYHTHSRLLAICQQSCQELSNDMSCPSWHTTGPQETYLWRSCKCRPGCWHVPVSDLDGAAALCCWPYGMGRRPVSQHLLCSMYNACLPQGVFTVHSV